MAAAWELVVSADRAYFEQMGAEGVEFPDDYPPRRFALERERMRLGRRRPAHGDVPEIDLSGPPEDPAISHVQALLVRRPDGSYEVIDPGSTNGMTLNEDPLPLAANVAVPLADGDRLRFGAWTKVTVRGPGGRAEPRDRCRTRRSLTPGRRNALVAALASACGRRDVRGGGQKSRAVRTPCWCTRRANWARFSFWASSPSPKRSNSTRRFALTESTL